MVQPKKADAFFENNITVKNCSQETVMLQAVLANQRLIYRLIESNIECDDIISKCYGIEIECHLFGDCETSKILDITSNIEFAKELFDLLCTNLVTPISLKDIAEDFITEKYSYT